MTIERALILKVSARPLPPMPRYGHTSQITVRHSELNPAMYAKDYFASTKLIADPGLCFVLMPFAPSFNETWEAVRETVAGEPFNLLCRRADDIARPGHIMADVLKNIGESRLLIADLSGQNPNVFYELGIAHTMKDSSRVILLSSDANAEAIPYDLRQLRCINYDRDLQILRTSLAGVLNDLGVKQYSLSLGEGQSGRIPARLTGDDHCLYEVGISVDYVGDDGVKFELQVTRYAAGASPASAWKDGHYLGVRAPAMKVPEIPWSVCYHKADGKAVRFILGRPPGWEEPSGP